MITLTAAIATGRAVIQVMAQLRQNERTEEREALARQRASELNESALVRALAGRAPLARTMTGNTLARNLAGHIETEPPEPPEL
jgi:hypothetical protein